MSGRPGQHPPPTWLEWGARIVSVVLIGGLILYVIVDGLRATTPPTFEYAVDHEQIAHRGADWVVPAVVTNTGSVSVSGVGITMELLAADGSVTGEETITVDLFGRGATMGFEFVFDADPTGDEIRVRVDGYQLP